VTFSIFDLAYQRCDPGVEKLLIGAILGGEFRYLRWLPVSRGMPSRDTAIRAGTGVPRTSSKDSWSEGMLDLIG
jgi:hypothetical protein